jgi:hypothetical protein
VCSWYDMAVGFSHGLKYSFSEWRVAGGESDAGGSLRSVARSSVPVQFLGPHDFGPA